MTEIEKRLQKIYQRIPRFECEPGCSDCCGPIFMCKTEWARFRDHRPVREDLTCPYLVNGRCNEYGNRPFICRIFGATELDDGWRLRLRCPKGCKPAKPLTEGQVLHLTRMYDRLSKAEGPGVGPAAMGREIGK